ncbi:MAG: hypothetical protein LBM78_04050 [Clostridiales bacterium]|jgi:hypothetical protein|nr:hypothetical protein [Clostridiales bacterium]
MSNKKIEWCLMVAILMLSLSVVVVSILFVAKVFCGVAVLVAVLAANAVMTGIFTRLFFKLKQLAADAELKKEEQQQIKNMMIKPGNGR